MFQSIGKTLWFSSISLNKKKLRIKLTLLGLKAQNPQSDDAFKHFMQFQDDASGAVK